MKNEWRTHSKPAAMENNNIRTTAKISAAIDMPSELIGIIARYDGRDIFAREFTRYVSHSDCYLSPYQKRFYIYGGLHKCRNFPFCEVGIDELCGCYLKFELYHEYDSGGRVTVMSTNRFKDSLDACEVFMYNYALLPLHIPAPLPVDTPVSCIPGQIARIMKIMTSTICFIADDGIAGASVSAPNRYSKKLRK